MSIPDFQSVMRPVLEAVRDGVAIPLSVLRESIADVFQLTEEERKERLPSGHQTVINNRVGWARTYLNKAGLLTIPSKGMVQITARGREALANGPERITVAWLKQFPEFADFHTAKPQSVDVLGVVETTPSTSTLCGLAVWKSANSGNCFSQATVMRSGPLASASRPRAVICTIPLLGIVSRPALFR